MNLIKVLLMSLLFSSLAQASDFHLMQLDELSVDYKNYAMLNDKARNLLIYPEFPKEGIDVNINTSLLKVLFFNSKIESLTTGSQYKSIGLQLWLGVRISNYVELGYWHHSQHLLDTKNPNMKFPSEDAVNLKVYFYRANKLDNVLFN